MSTTSEKLARAKAKEAQQKKIVKMLEAKKRREEAAEGRKLDTRRKVLLGTWILERVRAEPQGESKRKQWVAELILRHAKEYRDYEVMKDLYREFTGKDLPTPPKPEKIRPDAIQPTLDSPSVGEAFAGGASALSEVAPNGAEEPFDRP
ncbi:hypothetical protein J4G37_24605 [Microvirga sp. 3-52]|nr:hypothetical protein [Microvirga sp. 3-52]